MNEDKLRRVYTGVLNTHMTGMEKNELKGYLRGDSKFRYGFHPNREPMYFDVRSSWLNEEDYNNYLSTLVK